MNNKIQITPRLPFNVGPLLEPKAVAIVGVSAGERSFGNFVLSNLNRFGFKGAIHLVSRSSDRMGEHVCVPSIDDLPDGIDVAVLTVPEAAVIESIEACGRRGIKAAVVFASGFAEAGEEGRQKQELLSRVATDNNVMVVGPNCMGLTNFVSGVPLTFEPLELSADYTQKLQQQDKPGVAAVAQSGAMANNLRDALISLNLPVMYSISTGNEAVLCIEDHLAYLIEDDRVGLITLYVEQVRYPTLFLDLVRRARVLGKPIVMLMPGRSSRARDAVQSHTGALAGNHAAATTLLRAEGVVMVDTLDELFDTSLILHRYPRPAVGLPSLLTNSGAVKNCALDLAEEIGLEFPAFSESTVRRLEAILPGYAVAENPLDFTTISARDPDAYSKLCQAVLSDDQIGGVMVGMMGGPAVGQRDKARHLIPAIAGCEKPAALIILGDYSELIPEFRQAIEESGIPFFRSLDRAVRAFANVVTYARVLQAERGSSIATRTLPVLEHQGLLSEYGSKSWLAGQGIDFPAGGLATSIDEALKIADRIGYPVVLKAQAAALPHKSDAGGVKVNLKHADDLKVAYEQMLSSVAKARPELVLDGVLVEKMGASGVELIVGARRDPEWGPVLMVGLGGIWIEALKDVRLLPATATEQTILDELQQLKGVALLNGLRGSLPVDTQAVAQVVATLGKVMLSCPEVIEIDINPLVAYPDGAVALDALVVTAQD